MGSSIDTAVVSYGADEAGLVCSYLFGRDACGRTLSAAEAAAWIHCDRGLRGDEFLWLHFNLAHNAAERWIKTHLDLSEQFFEALRDGSHTTRIEHTDGTLIAVINDVHYDFSFEPSSISTLWISISERLVVTARRHALRSVDRLRAAVKKGAPIRSTVELLIHLLHDQADVLVNIVRDATARVDDVEETLLADRLKHRKANLGALRRLMVRLQRLLAPEPATLFRLLQHPPEWMRSLDAQELRHSTEEFSVVLRDMASLQERIKLLQEEIAAHINEDNNRSLFVLTIVTVLALPINIVAGLLGMNVGGIPLAQQENGFWIIVAIVLAFTVTGAWLAFRKMKT